MERPALNAARSPISIAQAQQVPTEQDVYATAMLFRQKAKTAGRSGKLMPGFVTGDPPFDAAGLVQMSYIGFRQTQTGA